MVAVALSLVACGGQKLKSGKENTAAAVYETSRGAKGADGSLFDLMQQKAGGSLDVSATCPHGGNSAVHLKVAGQELTSGVDFTLTYTNCSYDEGTQLNGSYTSTLGLDLHNNLALALKLDGRIDFSGEISDFVEAHLTQTLTTGSLNSASGAQLSLVLDGTAKTSTESYAYTKETLAVTAGVVQTEGN